MTQFKDFFGDKIAIGDWLHLARTSNDQCMRFAQVKRIGSTGKLLLQAYASYGPNHWSVNTRLIPCHTPETLTWKVKRDALPVYLRNLEQ